MVVYGVYKRNKKGEPELIGILPERRIDINKDRATTDSLRKKRVEKQEIVLGAIRNSIEFEQQIFQ
jgi:hypothetical protein